jgi:hypothetical protein
MTVKCGDCAHWSTDWPDDADPDDQLGECGALDPATIPHAWRWCPRERTGVYFSEQSECPMFKSKA